MFRLTLRAQPLTPFVVHPVRFFHPSIIAFKGKKGGKKPAVIEEAASATEGPLIDLDDASKKLGGVVERFSKIAQDAKLGKSNPKIFDKLIVDTNDGEMPFPLVAQTSIKGRNFIITLFDPINAKHVINSVLGLELNLNAQADPSNKYTLKVPLPPVSTETKKENVKALKEQFEKYKSGKNGLAGIRADLKQKFQKNIKLKKLSDLEQKEMTKLENLHKKYADKLAEAFKQAETAILK